MIDPTYLRIINDGLYSGILHKDNASGLPMGLVGMYDEALPPSSNVNERKKFLDFFAVWALLKKEVSLAFLIPLLEGWSEEIIIYYINKYSKWFNSPQSGKYVLYHERLRAFILQKISKQQFNACNETIIIVSHDALSRRSGDEWENYALEYLSNHMLIPAIEKGDSSSLKSLGYDTTHWNRQVEISKGFEWSKRMLNNMMLWASKYDDEEVIECALNKVDLHHLEQNDAPRIVELVAQNDIETALQRIEAFGGYDNEGLRRNFVLYILCLMELTLLGSKEKPWRKDAIEKLLKHLDNKQDFPNVGYLNEFPFPSNTMLQIVCQLENLKCQYLILFKHHSLVFYDNWELGGVDINSAINVFQNVNKYKLEKKHIFRKENEIIRNIAIYCANNNNKLETAKQIIKKIKFENRTWKNDVLMAICIAFARNGEFKIAFEHVNKIISKYYKALSLIEIAIYLNQKLHIDKSIKTLQLAIDLIPQITRGSYEKCNIIISNAMHFYRDFEFIDEGFNFLKIQSIKTPNSNNYNFWYFELCSSLVKSNYLDKANIYLIEMFSNANKLKIKSENTEQFLTEFLKFIKSTNNCELFNNSNDLQIEFKILISKIVDVKLLLSIVFEVEKGCKNSKTSYIMNRINEIIGTEGLQNYFKVFIDYGKNEQGLLLASYYFETINKMKSDTFEEYENKNLLLKDLYLDVYYLADFNFSNNILNSIKFDKCLKEVITKQCCYLFDNGHIEESFNLINQLDTKYKEKVYIHFASKYFESNLINDGITFYKKLSDYEKQKIINKLDNFEVEIINNILLKSIQGISNINEGTKIFILKEFIIEKAIKKEFKETYKIIAFIESFADKAFYLTRLANYFSSISNRNESTKLLMEAYNNYCNGYNNATSGNLLGTSNSVFPELCYFIAKGHANNGDYEKAVKIMKQHINPITGFLRLANHIAINISIDEALRIVDNTMDNNYPFHQCGALATIANCLYLRNDVTKCLEIINKLFAKMALGGRDPYRYKHNIFERGFELLIKCQKLSAAYEKIKIFYNGVNQTKYLLELATAYNNTNQKNKADEIIDECYCIEKDALEGNKIPLEDGSGYEFNRHNYETFLSKLAFELSLQLRFSEIEDVVNQILENGKKAISICNIIAFVFKYDHELFRKLINQVKEITSSILDISLRLEIYNLLAIKLKKTEIVLFNDVFQILISLINTELKNQNKFEVNSLIRNWIEEELYSDAMELVMLLDKESAKQLKEIINEMLADGEIDYLFKYINKFKYKYQNEVFLKEISFFMISSDYLKKDELMLIKYAFNNVEVLKYILILLKISDLLLPLSSTFNNDNIKTSTHIPDQKLQRFNQTLDIQWAIDIRNSFNVN